MNILDIDISTNITTIKGSESPSIDVIVNHYHAHYLYIFWLSFFNG